MICVEPAITETFVNDGLFRLADPSSLVDEAIAAVPVGADLVGARYLGELLSERQRLFWEQINRTNPETWVGNGHRLMFASRNAEIFRRVFVALRNSEEASFSAV